jgi:hypothetical protein
VWTALIRMKPSARTTNEPVIIQQDRARHDLQACRGLREKLAASRWTQPVAERECPWLGELKDITIGHGVSLLTVEKWRLRTPPRYVALPFMPSPTFVHSSRANRATVRQCSPTMLARSEDTRLSGNVWQVDKIPPRPFDGSRSTAGPRSAAR